MNADLLEAALRAADPLTGDEPTPSTATTIAEARRRSVVQRTATTRRRRRITLALAGAGVAASVIAVPVVSGGTGPHAAAIRLVAFKPPSSIELPFGVAVAPEGWHIAASKPGDGEVFEGVVNLAPAGHGPQDNDSINIAKYAVPQPPFSDSGVWFCPGPTIETVSNGRPTLLMRGSGDDLDCQWSAQVQLSDGGEFLVQAPRELTREQFETFLDGLSEKPTG